MGILDLLSELPIFLSSVDDRDRKKKKSILKTLSVLLIFVGAFWLIIELAVIKELVNPILFISLGALASLVIAILLVLALFFIRVLNSLTLTDFILFVLALSLNLFCTTSYLNRKADYKLMKKSSAAVTEEYLTPNKV
jgi:vacuolar-type H+-ATPase subunit I/STV1